MDGNITITGASSSTGATVAWNVLVGSGTLSSNTTLTPTYTPSTQDYLNGEVRLEVRAFGTSGCADTNRRTIITLTPTPVVNKGSDARNLSKMKPLLQPMLGKLFF